MTGNAPVMSDTLRPEDRNHTRLVFLSRLALVWERTASCAWQPVAVVFAFMGISFMGVLPLMPLWLHTLVLLAGIIFLCVISSRAFDRFSMPCDADVIAWIERRNNTAGRPLSAIRDNLSGETRDALSLKIWQAHLDRARVGASGLSVPPPAPETARYDPAALRIAALLVLFIGIVAGYGNLGSRLQQALIPTLGWMGTPLLVDVWVTPPLYTGHAPFHLTSVTPGTVGETQPALTIPVGSRVLVQVGSERKPTLMLGNRDVPFEALGRESYRADTPVKVSDVSPAPAELVIATSDSAPVRWPVQIVDDLSPVPDFTAEPHAASRGRLKVSFEAWDDYGLDQVSLRIINAMIPEDSGDQRVVRINMPLPHSGVPSVNASVIRDLSEHEWAGLPVSIDLEATDAIGQTGRSGVLSITLPERPFNHPVAKKLVEFRKLLNTPGNPVIAAVRNGLGDISLRPGDFNNDTVAFLVMRVAHARLEHPDNEDNLQSVRRMLWATALRIEDGEFAVAGKALSEAQDRLMEALNDGTYGEEVSALLDTLREALDRFMAALTEQLAQKGLDGISDLPGMAYMDDTDLMEMLNDVRNLAKTGSMVAARQVLEQLQAILDHVESTMNSGVSDEQYTAARQILENLLDITRGQEGLLDQTFRQTRQINDPANNRAKSQEERDNPNKFQQFAETQEGIRQSLRGLMPDLGGNAGRIPAPAIEAERSMQRSSQALAQSQGSRSVSHQSDALDALRRMGEMLAERMARQLQMSGGSGQDLIPGGGADPFGRSTGATGDGNSASNDVIIPEEFHIQRAQELIEELRERANDITRPTIERKYIKRLLQPFRSVIVSD